MPQSLVAREVIWEVTAGHGDGAVRTVEHGAPKIVDVIRSRDASAAAAAVHAPVELTRDVAVPRNKT